MYENLQTERLIIRPITAEDAAFIIELVNSEGWLHFIGDRHIKSTLDAEKYINKILTNQSFFYSVFELKTTREKLGIITFLKRENREYPDIGFALLPKFNKNGFAFEATKKYMEALIVDHKHEKILGITTPENSDSIKLLEKLGLTHHNNSIEDNKEWSIFVKEFK